MRRHQILYDLEARGAYFPGALDMLPRHERRNAAGETIEYLGIDADFIDRLDGRAFDAQPTLITNSNAGIPFFLTTYVDPKLVEVLFTPNKAAEIYGETRKGNWLDETAMFPMVESTGEVSSYGDYSENGRAGANVQYENRQSYLYQTFTEWGERELERMGRGRVDWAARLNIASAITMQKWENATYFYGVANLLNYGGLNDPSLSAALVPGTKAAGGTGWQAATPSEILTDVQSMFAELQIQTGSNLELDAPLTLALHSVSEVYLFNTNQFGLNAAEMIKKVFPKIRIIQAPQYLSGTTYSAQLIVDEVNGQRTCEAAFNEKMRAHPVIPNSSSFKQKKTGGTWGTIIYFPAGIASMAGI